MMKSNHASEFNSEFAFTVKELAAMNLPGFPTTDRAWLNLVKREGWSYRELKGKGRGGVHRKYTPNQEVISLIEAGKSVGETYPSKENAARSQLIVKTPYPTGSKISVFTLEPSTEWLMRVSMLAEQAPWLSEIDHSKKLELVMRTFNLFIQLTAGNNEEFIVLSERPNAILSALRLVFEMYSIEKEAVTSPKV